MLARWKVGRLECWNSGMVGGDSSLPLFYYSIIPPFLESLTPETRNLIIVHW
jgi:hypothetical protein